MTRKKRTRFELLSKYLLFSVFLLFVFFSVYCQSMQSVYNRDEAMIRNEIKALNTEKESLQMQITEKTTLGHLIEIAAAVGYEYHYTNDTEETNNEEQENTTTQEADNSQQEDLNNE